MKDLKQRTLRGGLARVGTQAANFVVRMGSLMILARLLGPRDFGLVGMVTAVIGVFSVFRDFGLSAAAVQRTSVTREQSSTLFWINLVVGACLTLLVLAMAPLVAMFYHEPRLVGVTAVMATGFLFNAAGVQHSAQLERQMRFTTMAYIDVCSLLISTTVGISMAKLGFGYWALVASASTLPLGYSIGVWVMTGWIPGRPQRNTGVRSMMHFGATLTLNGLVTYLANNLDKVLLGRFWGVDALGIYGRAYQLINIPTDNLNFAAGGVAFAALSRVKDEPARLKNYFLKGYALILSLTVPITFTCALYAQDMIRVFLGAKWHSAATVFQYLAPTALGFAILSPLGWLITSLGMVGRGLRMALVFGPLMVVAYAIGLSHGPKGVALSVSGMKLLTVIPLAAWVTHGTVVTLRDILVSISRPLFSGIVAAAAAFTLSFTHVQLLPPIARLAIGLTVFAAIYLGLLMFVMDQKQLYVDLVRGFFKPTPDEGVVEASA
jgi:O-antigen/teichoic acid export membrane protein